MSTLLGYFFLALGVSFICSTLESVMLSVTHSHIGILVKTNHRSGKLLQHLKDDINRPLAAILTLNTIANTVGATGVGAQAMHVFGSGSVAMVSGILTFCILVFSQLFPKTFGAPYWKRLFVPPHYIIGFLLIFPFQFFCLS